VASASAGCRRVAHPGCVASSVLPGNGAYGLRISAGLSRWRRSAQRCSQLCAGYEITSASSSMAAQHPAASAAPRAAAACSLCYASASTYGNCLIYWRYENSVTCAAAWQHACHSAASCLARLASASLAQHAGTAMALTQQLICCSTYQQHRHVHRTCSAGCPRPSACCTVAYQ